MRDTIFIQRTGVHPEIDASFAASQLSRELFRLTSKRPLILHFSNWSYVGNHRKIVVNRRGDDLYFSIPGLENNPKTQNVFAGTIIGFRFEKDGFLEKILTGLLSVYFYGLKIAS